MAIAKGSHIKKQDCEAIFCMWIEALKKEDRYYDICKQSNLKTNYPLQLKISPIAEILFKLRLFCIIQYLFFNIKLSKTKLPSTNEAITILLPKDTYQYIESALLRLIFLLVQVRETKPVYFAKGDIKDGSQKIFIEEEPMELFTCLTLHL